MANAKKIKRTTVQDILNEIIIWGGQLCTRGEAILYLQSIGIGHKSIDWIMFCRDQHSKDNPEEIEYLKRVGMYHEFSKLGDKNG